MVRSLVGLGIAALICASSVRAEEPSNRIITVTGTATVHYLPDAARIQFRIRSSEPTLEDVQQANQKATKLVDEKLSALKIKDMKIAFAPMTTIASTRSTRGFGGDGGLGGPGGGGPGGGGPAMANRNINVARTTTLIIRDTDIEKLSDAVTKIEKVLADAGAAASPNSPDDLPSGLSVTMFRREDSEFRDEALTKAVQNALQKAKALAKGANVQIKDTVSIVEVGDERISETPARLARTLSTPASGELEITVRVTVKCSY